MHCRHTVPDWHRHVAPEAAAFPLFAACRLLLKEGQVVDDPRGIACGYWGRQTACPLYEGPGRVVASPAAVPPRSTAEEVPLAGEAAWPVRPPGAHDPWRIAVGCAAAPAVGLLVATGGAALLLPGGAPSWLLAATIGFSLVGHALSLLGLWARRPS